MSIDIERIIEQIQLEHDISYDEVQLEATVVATSKFMVLTGGPGTERLPLL